MTTPVHGPGFTIYQGAAAKQCPECAGDLLRASRLPLDRLRSMFNPVYRYRCPNFACQWRGSLPVDGSAGVRTDQINTDKPPRFTVAGLLFCAVVIAGLVLVLLAGRVDLLPDLSATTQLPAGLHSSAYHSTA